MLTHSMVSRGATTIIVTGIMATLISRNTHVHRHTGTAGMEFVRLSNGAMKSLDHGKRFSAAPSIKGNTGNLLQGASAR